LSCSSWTLYFEAFIRRISRTMSQIKIMITIARITKNDVSLIIGGDVAIIVVVCDVGII